jgi:hypothetical protein
MVHLDMKNDQIIELFWGNVEAVKHDSIKYQLVVVQVQPKHVNLGARAGL